jgi:hypothetical protein
MNKTNRVTKPSRFGFLLFLCTLILCIHSKTASAADPFSFSPYIDLSTQGLNNKSWLAPIANPNQTNELFLTDTMGMLYQTYGKKVQSTPLFDFSSHLPGNSALLFSAITLHPNFHLLDQVGSKTVYTAHMEAFDSASKNDRLQANDSSKPYTHDAVVLEWQINNASVTDYKLIKVREVIRIATTSLDVNVNQLAFNHQLKSWDENFGLLFISLGFDKDLADKPLYSGSVLRINPEQFGTINYSIPQANPFIADSEVNDELVLFGAQNTSQFIWTKHTKDNLFLSHNFNNQSLISLVSLGSNLQLKPPVNNIYQGEIQTLPTTNQYFKGRDLSRLRNKFVVLTQSERNWQLQSISIGQPLKAKTELTLSSADFSLSNQLELHTPRENEILMWDKTQSIIFKLTANIVTTAAPVDLTSNAVTLTKEPTNKKQMYYIAIGAGAFCILLIVWFVRRKYKRLFTKTKTLLRSNYARFRFDETSKEVSLFKRHQAAVDKVIPLDDIYNSEIYLNEKSISDVSSQQNKGFSNEIDKAVRTAFEKEHQHKMVDKKVRRIDLKLFTRKGEEVLICSYLREGNQRLTRENYHVVIESLLDWQWALSSHLHGDNTPERAPKLITKKPRGLKKVVSTTQAIEQATKVQPASENAEEKLNAPEVVESSYESDDEEEISSTDNLVDSLNKLVDLKKRGYLTEEEFLIAKSNVLTKSPEE